MRKPSTVLYFFHARLVLAHASGSLRTLTHPRVQGRVSINLFAPMVKEPEMQPKTDGSDRELMAFVIQRTLGQVINRRCAFVS
jgi:hypothetical protein